mmetsp:Transcript_6591/g.19572  ORF Transcript_6591/g.19572 Transcript_6591/m.19572 type:complete len:111 (+) Transcript_6591:530-862(+)
MFAAAMWSSAELWRRIFRARRSALSRSRTRRRSRTWGAGYADQEEAARDAGARRAHEEAVAAAHMRKLCARKQTAWRLSGTTNCEVAAWEAEHLSPIGARAQLVRYARRV